MRFLSVAAVGITTLLQLASAQSLAGLPSCAISCATNAIGATGCAVTDAHCICTASSFLSGVATCIQGACSPADQQATLQFAQSFCGNAGVTITLPSAAATSAPAGQTMTPSPTATTTITSAAPVTSSEVPETAPPSTFTGAAVALKQQWAGVAGLVGVGVAAML